MKRIKYFISPLLIVFISFNFTIAQEKSSLKIISSNNLDFNDIKKVKDLYNILDKNKISKKLNITYYNILADIEDDIDLNNNKSIDDIDTNYLNAKFENINSLIDNLEKSYLNENTFQYIKQNLKKSIKLKLNINDNISSDINDIAKWIKKNKKNDLYLIWNNGFLQYKYNLEFITKIIEQHILLGTTIEIIPKITKPDTNYTKTIIADETHYKIEFDSVGVFPKYQIQISKVLKNGNSKIILDECLDFILSRDFNKNKSTITKALFIKNSNKCVFAISEAELGLLCIKYSNETEDIVPIEKDCNCQYDCLYDNQFILTVRGCVDGLEESEIPSSIIHKVAFQCNGASND